MSGTANVDELSPEQLASGFSVMRAILSLEGVCKNLASAFPSDEEIARIHALIDQAESVDGIPDVVQKVAPPIRALLGNFAVLRNECVKVGLWISELRAAIGFGGFAPPISN